MMTIQFTFKAIFFVALTVSYIDESLMQNATWFPKYHIRPEKGWINDPNGLIYHRGYYHVFMQYNTDAAGSGLKQWGHARSTDLLTWDYLPIALAPSLPEDKDGIFSGSAVVKDDNLTIIYTGVSENSTRQRQMAAVSVNGTDFEKLGVIIDRDGDENNFRDPKAWWQNGSWFVVIGSRTPEGRGEVLLYKSPDFFNWTYEGPLAQADEKLGYMWECPDFFTLGNKKILVISPQGIEPDGYDYQNLYQTGYFVGSWTPESNYTIEKGFREIDHGHDFYAPQTFLAPDGRIIQIGWLDMWESKFLEESDGWAGMLTLPRELTLSESGDLKVNPIREIEHARVQRIMRSNLVSSGEERFSPLTDDIYSSEIFVTFDLAETTSERFGVGLSSPDFPLNEGVQIYINRTISRLFLVRQYSQYNIEESTRSTSVDLTLPELSLDIFIDRSSIELFVNNGQSVMSSRIYPNDEQRTFYYFLFGGKVNISSYYVWDI